MSYFFQDLVNPLDHNWDPWGVPCESTNPTENPEPRLPLNSWCRWKRSSWKSNTCQYQNGQSFPTTSTWPKPKSKSGSKIGEQSRNESKKQKSKKWECRRGPCLQLQQQLAFQVLAVSASCPLLASQLLSATPTFSNVHPHWYLLGLQIQICFFQDYLNR